MRFNYPVAPLMALLLTALPSYGEVYRWTDQHGHAHYDDKPSQDKTPLEIERSGVSRIKGKDPAKQDSAAESVRRHEIICDEYRRLERYANLDGRDRLAGRYRAERNIECQE